MDPSAQGNTKTAEQAAPTTTDASTPPAADTGAAQPATDPPPVTPVASVKRKQFLPNLPIMLGFIVVFFLGIGFEKFHVLASIKSMPLPKIVVVMPSPKPSPTPKMKKVTSSPTPTLTPTLSATPSATRAPTATGSAQKNTPCTTDSDCSDGATCLVAGPIVAGKAPNKICVGKGQVVAL